MSHLSELVMLPREATTPPQRFILKGWRLVHAAGDALPTFKKMSYIHVTVNDSMKKSKTKTVFDSSALSAALGH